MSALNSPDKKLPDPKTALIPEAKESQDLQARFEKLIDQVRTTQQKVSEQTAVINHPTLGQIHEEVYAELDVRDRPRVGVHWSLPQGGLTYHTQLHETDLPEYGSVMLTETLLDVDTLGQRNYGLNSLGSVGNVSAVLSARADQPMVQAMTNAIQKPILHMVHCDLFRDESWATQLKGRGYEQHKHDEFSRLYKPQNPSGTPSINLK